MNSQLCNNSTVSNADVLSVSLFPAPGPGLPEEKLVVAVNWYGISFQEGKERTYLKLPYTRLTGVQIVRSVFVLCSCLWSNERRTPKYSLEIR